MITLWHSIGTRIDLEGLVTFTKNEEFYKANLSAPTLVQKSAISQEIFKQTEAQVRVWAKQIEMVKFVKLLKHQKLNFHKVTRKIFIQ